MRDGVDICYSSANKCLHSVSGVSFLCVAPEVWPRIAGLAPRVYYLDLARHRRYLDELRQTPFTPAVSSFFALETALDELDEQGGVPARRELYRKRNAAHPPRVHRSRLRVVHATPAASRTPSRCCACPTA